MCPGHFRFSEWNLQFMGCLIAVGALLGMGLVVLEAGRNHEDQNKYLDMMILSLAASVVAQDCLCYFSWELYQGISGRF